MCNKCFSLNQSEIESKRLPRGKHVKSSDFAINTQHISACMSCNNGWSEANKIFGMVDLPNFATMKKSSFPQIEFAISNCIHGISREAMESN